MNTFTCSATMLTAQHLDNVATAHAIIDGMPASTILFYGGYMTPGPTLKQGVGCPFGWLAQHPHFIAQGVSLQPRMAALQPVLQLQGTVVDDPVAVCAHLFGILPGEDTTATWVKLFDVPGASPYDGSLLTLPPQQVRDAAPPETHNALALQRLKAYYRDLSGVAAVKDIVFA